MFLPQFWKIWSDLTDSQFDKILDEIWLILEFIEEVETEEVKTEEHKQS